MSSYEVLRRVLSDRPIAFHPELARLFGGVNEALFFQQIAFWSDKGSRPDWIWKTAQELEREICLTRYQQAKARENLVRLGVIDEKREGMPAKLWYRVNWERLFDLLAARNQELQELQNKSARNSQPRFEGTGNQVVEEPANMSGGFSLSITENTPERTDRDRSNLRRVYDENRLTLLAYAEDFARELSDQSPLASTVTRLVNLKEASGLGMDAFVEKLYEAKAITRERQGSLRTERPAGIGPRPMMAYFLAVLEDITTP